MLIRNAAVGLALGAGVLAEFAEDVSVYPRSMIAGADYPDFGSSLMAL